MSRVELKVVTISGSHSQSGAYALILSDLEDRRRIPIIIGAYEAQAIAITMEDIIPVRPLTHDLFKSFLHVHKIDVKEVVITKFFDGVFFAEIVSENKDGEQFVTDSRTSDAIAIAVRFKCPIFTSEEVMSLASVIVDQDPENDDSTAKESISQEYQTSDLEDLDNEKLQQMLDDAVAYENYELASRIRDEINQRTRRKG